MPLALTNQFSSENAVSTASVSDFGFVANEVHVYNDKATPVYVTLNSTAPGTTAGFRTCASDSLKLSQVMTGYLGLASTTTSTATVARVLAVGR